MSPLRPWQNALAIIAAFFVAGALLPWEGQVACAVAAIGIVLLLGVIRMGSHTTKLKKAHTASVYDRIAHLRAERSKRFTRRR